eukprot:403362372
MPNNELISIGETLSTDLFPEANFTTNNYSNYWKISSLAFIVRTDTYGNILYLKAFDKIDTFDFYQDDFAESYSSLSNDNNFISILQNNQYDFIVLNANDGSLYEEVYIIQYGMQSSIAKVNLTSSSIEYRQIFLRVEYRPFIPRIIHLIGQSLYLFHSVTDTISTICGVYRFGLQDEKIRTTYSISGIFVGYFQYGDYEEPPGEINTRYHSVMARNYMRNTGDKIYVTLLKEINIDQIQSTFSTVKSFLVTTTSGTVSSYCSGIYLDYAAGQIGIGIFEGSTLSTLGVIDINQTGTVLKSFQIFYGAQLGVQLTFTYFRFITINTGLLCGYILKSTNPAYPIIQDIGVLISIPKPYYFEMATPQTRSIQVLDETLYIKKSNTHVVIYPFVFPGQTTITNSAEPYYITSAVTSKMTQPVEITSRKLVLPSTLPTHIIQYLGDNVKVVPFDNCTYDQSVCEDTEYTQYIQSTDGSALNSKFTYIGSTNTLYIALSNDINAVGIYNLKFKCRIQDGLQNEATFIVEYKYDGRSLPGLNQTTTNTSNSTNSTTTNQTTNNQTTNNQTTTNQTTNNQNSNSYNLAPMFYTNLQGFTIRAGGTAILYLPDFFDPNGDQVTISAKQNGAYTGEYFRFLDNNRMQFNAGLKQLGEQDITIILTDNNINPMSTKYRITVIVLQSDLIQMNNTDVVKSNLSDVISIQDTSKFKVAEISPTGLVTIKFEKPLNSTNETQLLQEIYQSLRLQIEDQAIVFNWTIISAKDNFLQIKIDFSRPLLVQSSGLDKTELRITLTNPSLFMYTNTNKSISYSTYVPPQLPDYDGDFVKNIALFFNNTFSSILITQLVVGSMSFDYMFSEEVVQTVFDIPDTDAYNDNFRDFGYDSKIAIENMGFNTFLLLISPALIVITLIIQFFAKLVPKFDQGFGISISSLISLLLFIICIFSPTLLPFLLAQNDKISFIKLNQIKPLHENLKMNKKWSIGYYSLFFIRRFIFVISMLFFNKAPYLQLMTFQLLSICQFLYLITVMPFENRLNNTMELVNEGLVLFTAEILILFTDFDPNPENRYMLGWVVLSVIFLVSFLNMSLFVYQAIQAIRKIAKILNQKLRNIFKKLKTNSSSSSTFTSVTTNSNSQSPMSFNETSSNLITQSTQPTQTSLFKIRYFQCD